MSLPAVLLTLRRDKRRHALQSIAHAEAVAVGFSGKAALTDYTRHILAEADEPIETEDPADIARDLGIPQTP